MQGGPSLLQQIDANDLNSTFVFKRGKNVKKIIK